MKQLSCTKEVKESVADHFYEYFCLSEPTVARLYEETVIGNIMNRWQVEMKKNTWMIRR